MIFNTDGFYPILNNVPSKEQQFIVPMVSRTDENHKVFLKILKTDHITKVTSIEKYNAWMKAR